VYNLPPWSPSFFTPLPHFPPPHPPPPSLALVAVPKHDARASITAVCNPEPRVPWSRCQVLSFLDQWKPHDWTLELE
jgi:hypothetical protein